MTVAATRIALVALLVCGCAIAAPAIDRVPRPEFEGPYRPPSTAVPSGRSSRREMLDVTILAAFLVLATEVVVRRRSRRAAVLVGLGSLAYFGFVREGCLCPIGSVQNVSQALAGEAVLPLATAATFVLPLGFALWRGRVFCGAVCPAGALQDLVLVRPAAIPAWIAEPLSLGRHLYLSLGALLAATGSTFLVCSWDPFVAVFRRTGSLRGVFLAGVFLLLAAVVARPYCRFLCPYGVLLGWCARLASRRASTCPSECVRCRLCQSACPAGALHGPMAPIPESVEHGIRRLAVLIALTPVAVAGGALAGARLEAVLARLDPTVRLAETMLTEDPAAAAGSTLETRAFRSGGRQMADLAASARAIRSRFRVGGALAGAYLGSVVMVALLRRSRRPRRAGYGPEPADCLACGRCFDACPQARAPLALAQEAADLG